jgi:hypothetical protein
MGIGAHQVELYDPENPGEPVIALAANFDPHTMIRWENRHSGDPLPERGLVSVLESAETGEHGGEQGETEEEQSDSQDSAFKFERESAGHGESVDPRFSTTGVSDTAKG